MVTIAEFTKQSEDGYQPQEVLPSGETETVSELATVSDVPKSEFKPSALQQFSGRIATNVTFGTESMMAKGLVFLGNQNIPSRDHASERAKYQRQLEAESRGEFSGELTATPEGADYKIGNAVRNAGWNWYFTSQERMRDLGADWTTGEGEKAHPVATMLADASTSLLACLGGFAVASYATKGVIMAAQGAKLIPAINAARTAQIATGVGKAVSIGGISGTVTTDTYIKALGKGYHEKLALALGIADGTLEGALEMWGLDNFLRKGASKIMYVARNMVVQGSEEFLQGVKQGVLHTWSGLREYEGPETYLDILTESLLAGVIGAVTGGVAGTGLAMSTHSDMVKSFVDIGFKKKEAALLANEAWKQAMAEATGVLEEDVDPDTILSTEEKFRNTDKKVAQAEKARRLSEIDPETGLPRGVNATSASKPLNVREEVETIPGANLALKGRLNQLDSETAALEKERQALEKELITRETAGALVSEEDVLPGDKGKGVTEKTVAKSLKGRPSVGKTDKAVQKQIDKIDDQLYEKDVERLGLELGPLFSAEGNEPGANVKVSLKARVLEKARIMALKNQVRKFNEGVKAGRKTTKAEIKAFQRRVVNTITESEVLTDKQKRRMLDSIPSIQEETQATNKRIKQLELRIIEMETTNLKNTYTKAISNILKNSGKKKKQRKMDPETATVFKKLIDLNKEQGLDPRDFLTKRSEGGMNFEDVLAYDIAVLNSGQASLAELKTIYDNLNTFFVDGVNKARAVQKKAKQERQDNITQVVKDMGGEGIEIDPNAPKSDKGPQFRGIFKYTFDVIMRRLANKSGKDVGTSFTERMFNTAKHDEAEKGIRFMFSRKNLSNYAESFGLDNDATVLQNMESDETTMSTYTWETGEDAVIDPETGIETKASTKETHSVTLSKSQVRKRVMEWQRDMGRKSLSRKNMYTEELIQDMSDTLTPADYEYMKRQFEMYTELYDMANGLYKKLRGINLPYSDFYTHLFSEEGNEIGASAVDTMLNDAGRPTFMASAAEISEFKSAKGGSLLSAVSDIFAMDKYINDIAHFVGFGNLVNNMQTILLSKDVRDVIKTKYGQRTVERLKQLTDDFRRGKMKTEVQAFRQLDNFRMRMVKGVLAVNPKLGVTQLVSTLAHLAEIPGKALIVGIADLSRAIESGDIYQLTEAIFMQTRGDTYQRDLVLLKQMADKAKDGSWSIDKNSKFDHVLLSIMRGGDRSAIYAGGWAMFKYQTEVQKIDKVTALRNFQAFTNKTQQSGDLSQMPGEISSNNPFTRLITTFKQAQYQYFNNYMDTIWNAKRMSPGLVAKKLFVYHALLPTIWQFVANAFRWDTRDQARALILGPAGELVIVGDALKNLVNWGWSKVYSEKKYNWYLDNDLWESFEKDVADTLDGFYKLASTGKIKADEGMDLIVDLAGALTPLLGAKAGVPKQAVKMVKGVQSMGKGEYLDGLYQFMGYSEYSITEQDRKKKKKSGGKVSFN